MERFRSNEKNEAMRITTILLLLIYSCSTTKLEHALQNSELCVQAIDSLTYDASYIIHLEDNRSGQKMKLLSRKKQLTQCDTELQVGDCYKIETTKLKSTSGFTDIGYRLGVNNVYENDSLVFAIGDYVVKSNQVIGLCYLSSKN